MSPINVNDIINKPLAGCWAVDLDSGSCATIEETLYLRLALCVGRDDAYRILQVLHKEAEISIPNQFEYVINELQFEIRLRSPSQESGPVNEGDILDRWSAVLADSFPLDDILDFVSRLKVFRSERL